MSSLGAAWRAGLTVCLAMLGAARAPAQTPVTPLASDRPLVFSVSDRYLYDDNLFRLPPANTPNGAVPGPGASGRDRINRLSATLDGAWTVGLQTIAAQATVADQRFANNTDLNHVSSRANVEWKWRLISVLSGTLGGDYRRALADFANTQFYGKDVVTSGDYYASVAYDLGPHWRLKGDVRGENAAHGASVRQGDDYDSQAGSLGVEYALSPADVLGLDYRFTQVGFRRSRSASGDWLKSDYADHALSAYVIYQLGRLTTLEAGAGYVNRTYARDSVSQGAGNNFSGDVWHVYVTWKPDVQVGVKLKLWRDLRAYVDAASNYFISHGASLGPVWSPLERLELLLELGREDQEFVGSALVAGALPQRHDALTYANASARYRFRRRIELEASYKYERRQTDIAPYAYRDHLAFVGLQYSF